MCIHQNSQKVLYQGRSTATCAAVNNFKLSCFEKHDLKFLFFQQVSLKLIDKYTSGSTFLCTKISLVIYYKFLSGTSSTFPLITSLCMVRSNSAILLYLLCGPTCGTLFLTTLYVLSIPNNTYSVLTRFVQRGLS